MGQRGPAGPIGPAGSPGSSNDVIVLNFSTPLASYIPYNETLDRSAAEFYYDPGRGRLVEVTITVSRIETPDNATSAAHVVLTRLDNSQEIARFDFNSSDITSLTTKQLSNLPTRPTTLEFIVSVDSSTTNLQLHSISLLLVR
jgi:hypothetical protein